MYTCPNCDQTDAKCEDDCKDCGTKFCNHCMAPKTKEEIERTDKVKCPKCGSLNVEATYH